MNGAVLLIFLALLVVVGGACWSMGRDYEATQWPVEHPHDPDCPCRNCAQCSVDFADVADTPDPYDWQADPCAFGADVIELRRGERR